MKTEYVPRAAALAARTVLLMLIATLALASPNTYIPITTYVTDYDSTGIAYDVQSDSLGAYLDNVNNVSTYLTSNGYNHIQYGDWQFNGMSSTVRTVNLSFDTADAVQPGDSHYTAPANPPWWGAKLVPEHMEDKCTLVNHDMLTMSAGTAFTCPFIIRFAVGSNDYRLYIAKSFTGYGETTDAYVSCNKTDSGGCNDWFVDPIPVVNPDGSTSPGKAVGRLMLNISSRNPVNEGDFYYTFHIHLTRP